MIEFRSRFTDRSHLVVMSIVAAAVSAALVYLFLNINFIPNPASLERGLIDAFIKLLLAIAGVFFGIIITVFTYVLVFFRQSPGDESYGPPFRGFLPLEITWTLIPLAIVVWLSAYGAIVLDKMMAPGPGYQSTQTVYSLGAVVPAEVTVPEPAETELLVNVTASRFTWQFDYPAYGITSYELGVPVNRRVLFRLQSTDVIHSFWVQEWGPKQDAVPGLTTELRITPTKTGEYLVRCSQLCGDGHTYMTAPVHVTSAADFQQWVQQQSPAQPPSGQPPPPVQPQH